MPRASPDPSIPLSQSAVMYEKRKTVPANWPVIAQHPVALEFTKGHKLCILHQIKTGNNAVWYARALL